MLGLTMGNFKPSPADIAGITIIVFPLASSQPPIYFFVEHIS